MWDNFLHISQIRQTLGTKNRLETLPVKKMNQVQLKFYWSQHVEILYQEFFILFYFWLVFCEKLINLCEIMGFYL